jgi:hypothetical protein
MAIKENIDFSTFSDDKSSKDLFSNAIRKAFGYDAYGDKTKFPAIVISDPIPLSPSDLKHFRGEPGKVQRLINTVNNNVTQFTYRARIIGENSPHSFLPDPCDSTYAADPTESFKIVAMHTLFVSNEEGGSANSLPRIGSIVEVELKKNVFGYNLQYGKHVKVVSNPEKNSSTSESCDTLKSAMANFDGSSLAATVGVARGATYEDNFDPELPPITPPVDLSKCGGTNFGNGSVKGNPRWHPAVDYGCTGMPTRGAPIYAVYDGVVSRIGNGKCREGQYSKEQSEEEINLKCSTPWYSLSSADKAALKSKYPKNFNGNVRLTERSRAAGVDCNYFSFRCGGNNGGNSIKISHKGPDGTRFTSLYCHIDKIDLVKEGDVVTEGQLIAGIGNTGNTTGPHLHFELQSKASKYKAKYGGGKCLGGGVNPIFYYHSNYPQSKRVKETGETMPEDLPEEEILSPESSDAAEVAGTATDDPAKTEEEEEV